MDIKQVLKDHRLWLRGEGGKRVAEAARLQAERDRQEAEELRRQNNLKHRKAVMAKVSKALQSKCALSPELSAAVVAKVLAGEIPNIQINF